MLSKLNKSENSFLVKEWQKTYKIVKIDQICHIKMFDTKLNRNTVVHRTEKMFTSGKSPGTEEF